MVGVLPRIVTSWSRNANDRTESRTPKPRAKKNAVEVVTQASSLRFWPSSRETMLPAPWPNMKPKAWMMDMKAKTMPTAPLALVPSWPTKAVSAML